MKVVLPSSPARGLVRRRPGLLRLALAAFCPVLPLAAAAAPCGDTREASLPALSAEGDAAAALARLQTLAAQARQRSAELQAAGLSAEAALADLDETRAAGGPQLNLSGSTAYARSRSSGLPSQGQPQAGLSLNLSAPLYDGGRQQHLASWRSRLADAAKLGADAVREQIVLETVGTALERRRLELQAEIYTQYVGKMGCLVGALQDIVAIDRGRASELVQARKNEVQAQISVDAVTTQMRQTDERLRKLLGDLSATDGEIAPAFYRLPALDEALRQAEAAVEVRQLGLQAAAASDYAKAASAARKPQLNWVLSRSATAGGEHGSASWLAGVSMNYGVYNGGAASAAETAALKRAEAVRLQQAEALARRQARVRELHEAAGAAFERARRYAAVLQDSDRVRQFTLEQWSQLGRRSLFDVMSAESDYYGVRVAYVNALHDAFSAGLQLRSASQGLDDWLQPGR
ncbi:TolC family protein [Aquabacterium sp. A7-Y]|uniref:TolC family protein n=1 Tax=Aquabacterium sp. A7-Y TaxID=1349605 RepID=UPI00223CB0BB|nr:TolC family protein [Aquabacterium sp. A7-Y]MCW7541856.1 TolC family protein [Aquabacterium sp. A7-Y]